MIGELSRSASSPTPVARAAALPDSSGDAPDGRAAFPQGVATERARTWSRRPTTWMLLATALTIIGVGAFLAVGVLAQDAPADGLLDASVTDPAGGSLAGVGFAGYIAAALGVVTVTREYRRGSTKPGVAAARRWRLVARKALGVGGVTFATTAIAILVAFLSARTVLSTVDVRISLAGPGVLRALIGAALYLAFLAVVGTAYGWILGSTARALGVVTGVFVLLPVVVHVLPTSIGHAITPYLPSNAGKAIMQLTPGDHLAPWTGFAVFAGYVAVVLLSATTLLRRRDP